MYDRTSEFHSIEIFNSLSISSIG
ncbi:hypothetical protein B7L09_12920 [Pseudomonas mandelii]|nr:hypothetical protein [Pseudomonas sp.]MSU95964.1 hypothetical protein [Pseudomonas mandelii]OYQ20035.1 hypothetical protein B7L09_12920 [Pseudomonas mandelii]